MKKLTLLMLLIGSPVLAARHSMSFDQMTTYADNSILDAAQAGRKTVTLLFPGANLNTIDQLTDSLRKRGYAIDEEVALNNPEMVKIRFLKNSAMVKLSQFEGKI